MPDLTKRPENIWKRLTRLFRSGPVVRHKIAAGERLNEPRGTARAYKKELSSLYVHSLASYGQYERLARYADYCLVGSTGIAVPEEGGTLPISEIVDRFERGEKTYVFSRDPESKRVVCAPVSDARMTGEREIWEIVLDNGQVVQCTDNHPFMLRDGSYLRADQLSEDVALMPFRRKDFNGYRYILPIGTNFYPEHVAVAEMSIGRTVDKETEHVHHRDFRRTNNLPDNLKVMLASEHLALHATINNKRFEDPAAREAMAVVAKRRWGDEGDLRKKSDTGTLLSKKGRESIRAKRVEFNKTFKPGRMNVGRTDQKGLDNANADRSFTFQDVCNSYKPGMDLQELISKTGQTRFKVLKRITMEGFANFEQFVTDYQNHKVVSVRKTGRVEKVFDLTVDKYHNFALSNDKSQSDSIFVHNSEMEFTPEICSAVDIYGDEVTSFDEHGRVINVVSKNAEVKETLETLFFDILNIEFNAWTWVRTLCKYGDFVLFVDASESNGILNLLPIPINEIEREEGYDKDDPFAVRFRWLTQGNMILENWQVIHFRLLGNDNFLPYGASIIEPARRIWRQLILIEDAMLVYRIVRSPERRVFYVDVGNIPPSEIETFMEQIKTRLRRTQVVDPNTGRVDLRYNPLSVDEDYFIPIRGDRSSKIETLAGGQFTGDIDDVQYIQGKLFAALKIPKSYLGYEGEIGSKATLAQQDVRFARTIERIQKIFISELNKIAIIHLFLLGYEGEDLVDFEIKMATSSTIALQQKLELWRTKFEIASTATEGMLDRDTVYRRIFDLTDDEIEAIKEGKRADKLEDLMLEAMQLPPEDQPGGGTPPGEPVPGEEELPQTLGGEEGGGGSAGPPEAGGEAPPPAEGANQAGSSGGAEVIQDAKEPQKKDTGWGLRCNSCGREYPWNTAFDPSKADCCADPKIGFSRPSLQDEKRNKGSEGNDALMSTGKGHDLFSTSQDLHAHVFGRKKQTASDPTDARYTRRLVTRPFSDGVQRTLDRGRELLASRRSRPDPIDESLSASAERTKEIEEEVSQSFRRLEELEKKN